MPETMHMELDVTYNGIPVDPCYAPPVRVVDVEAAMEACVREVGGTIVSDIVGRSPDFSNADYYFPVADGIVTELKRIVEDQAEDARLRQKMQDIYQKWVRLRRVPPVFRRALIQSKDLPPDCQRELLSVFVPAIKRRILKANRQIKETKVHLNLPAAKGLLLLVNDGNYALDPEMALYLIHRALGRECNSINSVVYFTVNAHASSTLTSFPTLVWVHGSRHVQGIDGVDTTFVDRLFEAWRHFHSRLVGSFIHRIDISTDRELGEIKFAKGPRNRSVRGPT
jgi:hypothetical protein